MDRILILLLYIFCQIIMFSDQSAPKVSSVPDRDLQEDEPVTLKCIAQGQHTLFEWILNDNVIVTTNANGNTTITQGRDPNVYVVELVNRTGKTKQVFRLIISRVSRFDSGRWTCRVTAPSGTYTYNHVVVVNYIPDPRYPECELSDQGYATCTTQIGRPRVDIQWMDIDGSVIRGSLSNTNTTMMSVEANVFNVQTPVTVQDSLTCQMTQPDRSCSILTEDIYDIFSITLTGNDDNSFICTVNPSEFMEYLIWDFDAKLLGNESSYGQSGTKITFGNVDFKWNGTVIKCVLKWGAFNTTYKTSYVAVDSPTTAHAMKLTDTTVPQRNPMNTEGEDIQNRDHFNRSPSNYPYETFLPTKGGSTTSRGGPPTSIPIGSIMFTTSDANSTSEETPLNNENVSNDGSGSGTLRIVIIAVVIAVIICLLIVVLCVCYNRKHAPNDAVI